VQHDLEDRPGVDEAEPSAALAQRSAAVAHRPDGADVAEREPVERHGYHAVVRLRGPVDEGRDELGVGAVDLPGELEDRAAAGRDHMPLLFPLAGVSSLHALRRRSPRAYLRERVDRLLVPLLFGLAVVVPPQAYLAGGCHGTVDAGYLAFLPGARDRLVRPERLPGDVQPGAPVVPRLPPGPLGRTPAGHRAAGSVAARRGVAAVVGGCRPARPRSCRSRR
jgi:hypothetical protein